MAKMSLGEAAKHYNIDKSKLSRALRKGEISGKKGEDGKVWQIEPSEMDRWVNTLVQRANPVSAIQPAIASAHTETDMEVRVLQEQLKALREKVEMLQADKDRAYDMLKAEQDRAYDTINRLTLLIEDHSAKAPQKPRGGLFGFFRGKAA